MAMIWHTVLTLPHMFAAITVPFEAATRRTEVTVNSRKMMIISGTALQSPNLTKQTSADITSILSARGSANLPKSVIRLSLRAILPSKASVIAAMPNSSPATAKWKGNSISIAAITNGTSTIRRIVSLLGRFIFFIGMPFVQPSP